MKRLFMSIWCVLLLSLSLSAQDSRYASVPITATITSGQSISSPVNANSCTLLRLTTPAGFAGTTLSFLVSLDGGVTYGNFRDSYGSEITITFSSATDVVQLDPAVFAGIRWLEVRNGTLTSPVNVSANRIIRFECKTF